MSRRLLTMALLLTATGCTPLDNALVAIFGRSMRDQRSFDPYENPRLPAENAIPFAVGDYPATFVESGPGSAGTMAAFTPQDLSPPGSARVQALANPVPADDASLQRGEVLYQRYCAVCHGAAGLSADAPIIDKLGMMAAYNLASGNAVGYGDGYIYAMIRSGRGLMPMYGHRIQDTDRWHVVNYVRSLQGVSSAPADPAAGGDDEPDSGTGAADSAATGGGER